MFRSPKPFNLLIGNTGKFLLTSLLLLATAPAEYIIHSINPALGLFFLSCISIFAVFALGGMSALVLICIQWVLAFAFQNEIQFSLTLIPILFLMRHYENDVQSLIQLTSDMDKLRKEKLFLERQYQGLERELQEAMDATQYAERHIDFIDKIFDHTIEGIMILDENFSIQMVNPAFSSITGYAEEEVLGLHASALSVEDPEMFNKAIEQVKLQADYHGEVWCVRKNGEHYPQKIRISKVDDGDSVHYVCVFHDIKKLKLQEEKIEHAAYYDGLTDLPNRVLFNDRLQIALQQAEMQEKGLALFIIDIDQLRKINETLGTFYGDNFLKVIASELSQRLRVGDTLARTGGDEFSVILRDVERPEDAAAIARNILTVFDHSITVLDQQVYVSASLGISMYPTDGNDLRSLNRSADLALLQAKEMHNCYHFCTEDLNFKAVQQLSMETTLRRSIQDRLLRVQYQPVIDLQSGELYGSEALVRLFDPARGLVAPDHFIPLAEETGLINQLGEWVLNTACRQQEGWNKGNAELQLAVNLSARQFMQGDLLERVKSVINETGINPENLTLELTENSIIKDIDLSKRLLHKIKDLGMRVSIDDFGTGYSSLGYLRDFPLDILKVDKSFIQNLGECEKDAHIVKAIVSMAHSMHLKVIAEGVETEDQLNFVKSLGCEFAQGYYFSRPLDPAVYESFIKKKSEIIV